MSVLALVECGWWRRGGLLGNYLLSAGVDHPKPWSVRHGWPQVCIIGRFGNATRTWGRVAGPDIVRGFEVISIYAVQLVCEDTWGVLRGSSNETSCDCRRYVVFCSPDDSSANAIRCDYCNHCPAAQGRVTDLGYHCKDCRNCSNGVPCVGRRDKSSGTEYQCGLGTCVAGVCLMYQDALCATY
ncbi:hypothetical protein MRX96_057406 [Rhipicephalus microplus]